MKKSKLKNIIAWLDNLARMNERHMQIQDGAILRKDKEIAIANDAANELRITLQETQDALDRSRRMVETLRLNSDSRSLRAMAKDLYEFYYEWKLHKDWAYTEEDVKWHWITLVVQILSWQDLLWRW